jgi:hypothetical protein
VAGELERRWNEKLERVAQLEQARVRSEQEARWNLAADERAAILELSQDLPAIWNAATTTNQERKQLLRLAIESYSWMECDVQARSKCRFDGVPERSRNSTSNEPLLRRFPQDAPGGRVSDSRNGSQHSYTDIAAELNEASFRTAFGRRFTTQHVGYICRVTSRHDVASDESYVTETVRTDLMLTIVEQEVLCESGLLSPNSNRSLLCRGSYTVSWSINRLSTTRHTSTDCCHSRLLRANRETSRAATAPTLPTHLGHHAFKVGSRHGSCSRDPHR